MIFVSHQETGREDRDPERLRGEILGLTNVLSIVEHQLGKPLPYTLTNKTRKNDTIDDILIHIANLLNTGSGPVVAVSGSPRSIMDLTLVVVAKGEGLSTTSVAEAAQSAYRHYLSPYYSIHNERCR